MNFQYLYHFFSKWQYVAPIGIIRHTYASVRHGFITLTLHPNGRVRSRWRSPEFERYSPNPSGGGFLCSPEHSKVCFQPLKIF